MEIAVTDEPWKRVADKLSRQGVWVLCEGQKGGDKVGRTRAGKASKRHVVVEGNGLPLACHPATGNVADITAAPLTLAEVKVPRTTRPPALPSRRVGCGSGL